MPIELAERIAFLKKIHLFYGLEEADLTIVAEELDEVQFPKGGVIFQQDTKAEGFYLIYGGSVRITRKQDRKEVQLALLVKNDYFGELALVANRRRSGTAMAVTDSTLLFLSRKDFENLFKNAPKLRFNLDVAVRSRLLARRLKFKWLGPDEVIYFLARKHPLVLWQSLFVPILGLIIPGGLIYIWLFVFNSSIVAIMAGVSLAFVLGVMAWLIVDWGNDYYIVTNQRVVWLERVVGVYDSRQETPLNSILSVGIESNQVGRFLDYGNVIVRTFVGKITFANVDHPEQASKMVEEYWNRTKEYATGVEKDAMKNAIRQRLGLPLPPVEAGFGETAPIENKSAPTPKPGKGMIGILKFLGANTLKLRYEEGETVVYRKHWIVLLLQAKIPLAGIFITLFLLGSRLVQLAFLPDDVFISLQSGLAVDVWALTFLMTLIPFLIWFIYEVLDWSNDKFEVTNDQIIDVDRKPFGTEIRNAAQLESIIGTLYERKGLIGNLFNFGTVFIIVGGNRLAFEDVMNPAAVQSDIDRRRLARSQKKKAGEVAAERERIADWIATYHRNASVFSEEQKNDEEQKKRENPG